MHAYITTLAFALLLTGCRHTNAKVDELIRTSTRLALVDSVEYLDGGSVSYVFTNQISAPVVIFLPNPNRDDSTFRRNGRTFQRIFVAPKVEFALEEAGELVYASREERHVIELVRSALRDTLSTAYRQAVQTALLVLSERRFDWKAVRD